ncbi:MAG TPA: hypothetical protein VND22_09315 [Actinomycetota bacterium]|nr:hypothetical protein [Actinomycetota bacterium]
MEAFEAKHLRAWVIAVCFLLASVGGLAISVPKPAGVNQPDVKEVATVLRESREVAAPANPAAQEGKRGVPTRPSPATAPADKDPAPQTSLEAYEGLGAWVDLFDFTDGPDQAFIIVEELASRGVKTLYVQTGRWNLGGDVAEGASMNVFIERAHSHGMKVVGWYLPGFNDIDTDIRRSLAVLNHVTPAGQKFDGFAPDIEDKRAVGNDLGRFNAGIGEYSRRLRAAVPPGTVLGAIVVDAKNNKRAPTYWAGFPWDQIGQNYDVVLPMAYWSVVKKKADCFTTTDVVSYQREVVAEMTAQMGTSKPLHMIGGIADCSSAAEIAAFADVSIELGAIGGSIYDFWTTHTNPSRDALWGHLNRFNR